jgi:hypothetical protein
LTSTSTKNLGRVINLLRASTGKERASTGKDSQHDVFVEVEGLDQTLHIPLPTRCAYHLFISPSNPGAAEVVEAAAAAFAAESLHTTDKIEHLQSQECACMLLLLTDRTWTNGATSDALAREVMQATSVGAGVLLAHERPSIYKDASGEDRHACEFADFFSTTPEVLLRAHIYAEIAVPLAGGAARPTSQLLLMKAVAKEMRRISTVSHVLASLLHLESSSSRRHRSRRQHHSMSMPSIELEESAIEDEEDETDVQDVPTTSGE